MTRALVLLGLAGCPWVSEVDLDGARDRDGDGFVSVQFGGDDCDDADAETFPGAPDAWYDGRLQDCDRLDDFDQDGDGLGVAEDCDDLDPEIGGPTSWHRDADGDGLGAAEVQSVACVAAGNVVADARDCDDTDAAIGASLPLFQDLDRDGFGDPAAPGPVRCDLPSGYAIDGTDCDDADPEEFPGAVWSPDLDGDGFGDPAVAVEACERPAGHVADATDCDDLRADVHPGASPEWPADGVDSDCDGGTELDFDGDGLPDLPIGTACPTVRAIWPVADAAGLVATLASPTLADCDVLELATGAYPPIVVERPLVIRAAAGAAPVFLGSGQGAGLTFDALEDVGLTLEGLRIEGFERALVAGPSSDLLGSELAFVGGVGIVPGDTKAALEDGSITLYDSVFDDGAAAVPEGTGDLRFERVRIDDALVLADLLVGGVHSTVLHDVTISDCGAVGELVEATGAWIELRRVSIEDSLGHALTVDADRGASVEIAGLTVARTASGMLDLVRVTHRLGVGRTAVAVSDLVVVDNTWFDPLALGGDDGALVAFEGVDPTLDRVTFRGNLMARQGGLLQITGSSSATIRAAEFSGTYTSGVVLDAGRLENVTFASGPYGIAVVAAGPVEVVNGAFDLGAVALFGATGPYGAPSVAVSWSTRSLSTHLGPAVPTQVTVADPGFARHSAFLPGDLLDSLPLPGSPLFDAGDPALSDPDGSRSDQGWTGGPVADPTALQDADADGLYDAWELRWIGDLADDGAGDPDGDGLDTLTEFLGGTLPLSVDTDGDGLPDGADPAPLGP